MAAARPRTSDSLLPMDELPEFISWVAARATNMSHRGQVPGRVPPEGTRHSNIRVASSLTRPTRWAERLLVDDPLMAGARGAADPRAGSTQLNRILAPGVERAERRPARHLAFDHDGALGTAASGEGHAVHVLLLRSL